MTDDEFDFELRAHAAGGFSVPEFDAWLQTIPPGAERDQLETLRARAKAAASESAMKLYLWQMYRAVTLSRLVPLAAKGARGQRGRAKGGSKTAGQRKRDAAEANAVLRREAKALRLSDPTIKQTLLAQILAERGLGARTTIEKKLARLLPKKKKSHDGR